MIMRALLILLMGIALAPLAWGDDDNIVALIGINQQKVGTVTMTPIKDGLSLTVAVKGMSEGAHGFHIHETGDCSDYGEGFKKAGAHVAEGAQVHGFEASGGPHTGDLPNINVNSTGAGEETFTAHVTLESLRDSDGSAFVFHDKADDYKTDPSGASGDRIACGVIAPPKEGAVK